ncbi:hypothetical protein T02_6785 [Trichinella nativa]|uniref:PiggyBac transposable element-derived protein domain-containing protein n=1 Tax=Trichinella nativa TaxID=6335 RepID=A0A0V1KVF2_9BILA|nr:hypothetical protein T02_6785 [Trichinella nativa]
MTTSIHHITCYFTLTSSFLPPVDLQKGKYGVKINWICDAENGYALKGLLYTGRNGEERQIDQTSTKAGQLAQPFVNSNRNVFMDRYFTSYSTVKHLLEHGLTAIDKVFAHRRDVLACLRKAAQRDPYSTLAVYEHSKKVKVDNQQDFKRPNIIGQNNGLYFIVEVCINNAFLLMRHQQSYQKTKKRFMRELSAGQTTHRNEIEMLGGITLHGKDAAVMLPKAQEALFLLDTKQKSGVFRKLVRLDEISTMGILTVMQVVVQDTDCQVSHAVSSYNDVLKKCRAEGQKQKCRIEYKYLDPSTATAICVKKVEESIIVPQRDQKANGKTIYIVSNVHVEEQIVAQHSQMFGGTTEYTDSDAHIKEQVKQAIFETDRKKTNGTYLWLEKIVNGYNMGISSHFQVLLKQTVCPIKVKRYNSYKKVYENCRGYGDLKNCTVEYKYFDPTISTVEC